MTDGTAPNQISPSMEDRILDAAYRCFERFGMAKTGMEDIASEANVSRRTVYRHFSSKDDIIDGVCCREAVKINAEVRRNINRDMDFPNLLTEALLTIVLAAHDNVYMRSVLETTTFEAQAFLSSSRVQQLNRKWWQRMMERAAANGEIAADLSLDDILSWLMLAQSMLHVRLRAGAEKEDLRRLIRRFVVEPLTTSHPSRPLPPSP
ncbi:MAG: TetR/AcrR family transcriptional regulator [Rhizobiales bacterium]|uniref:TetR/AcrR family transcriptional regulator n=1 Tax=Xanthobacter flavus TaxID=281 RepID=UPI001AD0B486|nr:TetR/AcrR family transcriptional regulator [Hyphomicrobiales bacterium]